MADRRPVKQSTQTQILIEARRRCCVCFGLSNDLGLKRGQISHIDGNPRNNLAENLAFLCFDHHDELDSRPSQSKGLTADEVRVFKAELANRVRQMKLVEEDRDPEIIGKERVLSLLKEHPEGQKLARMFGMPVTPAREDLSAFGRWKLRFKWKKSGLKAGLFLEDLRLFLFSGDEWHTYHFDENRVSEAVWVDTKADHDRRAKWIAAKESTRVYPEDSGELSFCEFIFEGDDVDVRERLLLEGHTVRAIAGEFDVNSQRFASADSASEVILWDLLSGSILGRMHSLIEKISNISYFPNPAVARLIVNNQVGEFEVLDFETHTSLGHSRLLVKGPKAAIWYSADLRYIVAADEFGRQEIVSAGSLETIEKSQWFGIFLSNCVSREQRVNAFKNATGQAWIFEREGPDGDYTSIDIVPPEEGKVTSMAVSADGTVFATVLDKQVLCVWERLPNAS